MKYCLTLYLVMWSCVAAAAELKMRLPVGRETYTLNSFHNAMPETWFGVYASPDDFTGGTDLALFPNGRFAIVETSDIGPDDLKALGGYAVHGDRLNLSFSKILPGQKDLKQQFSGLHILWGWIEKKGYVTGFEVFIFTAPEWQKLKENPKQTTYLQRRTPYYDWQATLRRYDSETSPTHKHSH